MDTHMKRHPGSRIKEGMMCPRKLFHARRPQRFSLKKFSSLAGMEEGGGEEEEYKEEEESGEDEEETLEESSEYEEESEYDEDEEDEDEEEHPIMKFFEFEAKVKGGRK
jgi:hypothetical protein